jgi:hypothetical protein
MSTHSVTNNRPILNILAASDGFINVHCGFDTSGKDKKDLILNQRFQIGAFRSIRVNINVHCGFDTSGKDKKGLILRQRFQIGVFGLSEWTTLIVYKWLLKLIHSYPSLQIP